MQEDHKRKDVEADKRQRRSGGLIRRWVCNASMVGLHPDIRGMIKAAQVLPLGAPDVEIVGSEAVRNYLWAYPPIVSPVRHRQEDTDEYTCVGGIQSFWLTKACFSATDEVHILVGRARVDNARMRRAALAELALMQVLQPRTPAIEGLAHRNLERLRDQYKSECAAIGIGPSPTSVGAG